MTPTATPTVEIIPTETWTPTATATEEIIQGATNEPGFNFNNQPLGNSGSDKALGNSQLVGTQGISSFALGRVNSELGYGGLVLSAGSENVSVLLRALQETGRLEVLSRPQVMTLDNQSAYIQVGQRISRIIGVTTNQSGTTNAVVPAPSRVILGVTPRISPDGTVVMEIDAEKSNLGPENQGIPVSISPDGSAIRSPVINTTTAQTTVSAANGETIVLGGLITKSATELSRRVPWLSEVPFLGWLFRYNGQQNQRTELLIFLTPRVISSPADIQRIKQVETSRMHWCCADVHEIHGGGLCRMQDRPFYEADVPVVYPDFDPRGAPLLDSNSLRRLFRSIRRGAGRPNCRCPLFPHGAATPSPDNGRRHPNVARRALAIGVDQGKGDWRVPPAAAFPRPAARRRRAEPPVRVDPPRRRRAPTRSRRGPQGGQ